jgi:hypothetical protein
VKTELSKNGSGTRNINFSERGPGEAKFFTFPKLGTGFEQYHLYVSRLDLGTSKAGSAKSLDLGPNADEFIVAKIPNKRQINHINKKTLAG